MPTQELTPTEQRTIDAQALEAKRAESTNTFLAGIASGDMSTNDAAQFAADNDVPLSEQISVGGSCHLL